MTGNEQLQAIEALRPDQMTLKRLDELGMGEYEALDLLVTRRLPYAHHEALLAAVGLPRFEAHRNFRLLERLEAGIVQLTLAVESLSQRLAGPMGGASGAKVEKPQGRR